MFSFKFNIIRIDSNIIWISRIAVLIIFITSLALGACSRTQFRINDNIAFFQSLPYKNQLIIKQSKIEVGFTPQEVNLAWGPPTHKVINPGTRGPARETWFYNSGKSTVKKIVFVQGVVDTWTVYPVPIPYSNIDTDIN